MAKFYFEGRGSVVPFTGNELTAKRNIRNAFNWIVGGYANMIMDECDPSDLPESRDALLEEVYLAAMNNLYLTGCEGYGKAPKEMRFAGEKFCKAYISWKIDNDEDCTDIARIAGWKQEVFYFVKETVEHKQNHPSEPGKIVVNYHGDHDGWTEGESQWEKGGRELAPTAHQIKHGYKTIWDAMNDFSYYDVKDMKYLKATSVEIVKWQNLGWAKTEESVPGTLVTF